MPDQRKTIDKNTIVAIIGSGTMGIGIAQVAARAGHKVKLYDMSNEILNNAFLELSNKLQKRVENGKVSLQEATNLLSNIQLVNELDRVSDCSLVVEVIVENIEIKKTLYKQLESVIDKDAVIATNTSSFSISALAKDLDYPDRFIGMHFFNPAPILKLVEVVSGLKTQSSIVDVIFELVVSWGKIPVKVKSSPGFLVNRIARPYYAEALKSLQEGVTNAATIDALMRETMGFKLGPFQLIDLVGLDINQAATQSIYDAYFQDPRFRPSVLLNEMVDAGFLGRKSKQGFYDYRTKNDAPTASYVKISKRKTITEISVYGNLDAAVSLVEIAKQKKISVTYRKSENNYIEINNTRLAMSEGLTASEVAVRSRHANTIVFDLANDYKSSPAIAIAAAIQSEQESIELAISFFHQIGKKVALLKDVPGLVALRTMCMLANEAADAANQGISDMDSIDMAMKLGVAYPIGPLEWAKTFGFSKTVKALENIHKSYAEERYRCSPWLKSQALVTP